MSEVRRLLLLRHGQTGANVEGLLDTAEPGYPLTELGHAQAAGAARVLGATPLVAVHASRLVRTQQTAAPTAADQGLEVAVVAGLEEVSAAEVELRGDHDAVTVYVEAIAAWLEGDLDVRLAGGESGHDFLARFDAAVAQIMDGVRPGATALAVSHGAAIRVWTTLRVRAECAMPGEDDRLSNTAMMSLALPDGADPGARTWTCEAFCMTPLGGEHLEHAGDVDPTGDLGE